MHSMYLNFIKTVSTDQNVLSISAFYDGNFDSNQAGDFVFNIVVPALKKACPGKKIYIGEYVRILIHAPT